MEYEPLDELIARNHPLLRNVQRALRRADEMATPEALCIAVQRLLTRTRPSSRVR